MHWHVDIGRVADLAERSAQRARADARHAIATAEELERQARNLRQAGGTQLKLAQLGETHGVDRQGLFGMLRGLALARAHVLECELRAGQLSDRAEDERERARELDEQAQQQQSRARRLQAVKERLRLSHLRARLRRQELSIQEEYACR